METTSENKNTSNQVFDDKSSKLKDCYEYLSAMTNGKVPMSDGNSYTKVAARVSCLREFFGFSVRIETEVVYNNNVSVLVKASVSSFFAESNSWEIISTGHSEEFRGTTAVGSDSALEKAETSSVGRALASLGLSGSEYASYEEMLLSSDNRDAVSNASLPVSSTSEVTVPSHQNEAKPSVADVDVVDDVNSNDNIKASPETLRTLTRLKGTARVKTKEIIAACGVEKLIYLSEGQALRICKKLTLTINDKEKSASESSDAKTPKNTSSKPIAGEVSAKVVVETSAENELPPELVVETSAENELPPELVVETSAENELPPELVVETSAENELPPEFVVEASVENELPPEVVIPSVKVIEKSKEHDSGNVSVDSGASISTTVKSTKKKAKPSAAEKKLAVVYEAQKELEDREKDSDLSDGDPIGF